jgi:hypothetical protein
MQRLQPATAAPCPGATGTRVAASQAAMQAKAQAQAQMQAQAPSAMEHAMHLDLQTHWPTHRIRSFLSLQPR